MTKILLIFGNLTHLAHPGPPMQVAEVVQGKMGTMTVQVVKWCQWCKWFLASLHAHPPPQKKKKLRWAGLLNKLGQMSALVSRQWMSGAGMIACDGSACTDKHGTLQVL